MRDDGHRMGRTWRLVRATAVISAACAVILVFMAIFTEPVDPVPATAVGTGQWTIVSDPSACRTTDERGYAYDGELTNHSRGTRDFTVRVAFEAQGQRRAVGVARVGGLRVGHEAAVEISVPASFPERLPEVTCSAEVQHRPAGG